MLLLHGLSYIPSCMLNPDEQGSVGSSVADRRVCAIRRHSGSLWTDQQQQGFYAATVPVWSSLSAVGELYLTTQDLYSRVGGHAPQ